MFYTYLWLREDGTPYYVGRGTKRRAFTKHKLGKCPPKDRVILQDWVSYEDSILAEKFLIAYYGREDIGTGCLLNFTDGGEGTIGLSSERIAIQLRNLSSPQAKEKQIISLRKYNEDPAVREQNAETQRKLWEDPEYHSWMTEKRKKQGKAARKQHCIRGHKRIPENRNHRGECLPCKKINNDINNGRRKQNAIRLEGAATLSPR